MPLRGHLPPAAQCCCFTSVAERTPVAGAVVCLTCSPCSAPAGLPPPPSWTPRPSSRSPRAMCGPSPTYITSPSPPRSPLRITFCPSPALSTSVCTSPPLVSKPYISFCPLPTLSTSASASNPTLTPPASKVARSSCTPASPPTSFPPAATRPCVTNCLSFSILPLWPCPAHSMTTSPLSTPRRPSPCPSPAPFPTPCVNSPPLLPPVSNLSCSLCTLSSRTLAPPSSPVCSPPAATRSWFFVRSSLPTLAPFPSCTPCSSAPPPLTPIKPALATCPRPAPR